MSCIEQAIREVEKAVCFQNGGQFNEAASSYSLTVNCLNSALEEENLTSPELKQELSQQIAFYQQKLCDIKRLMEEERVRKELEQAEKEKTAFSQKSEEDLKIIERIKSTVMLEKPSEGFSSVCGLTEAKRDLNQAVVLPIKFPEVFQDTPAYKGFLFFGPPGTGKSQLARAVAAESGTSTTFFSVSASDLTSKYQGESEQLVKNLFECARIMKPSVIFIDEIDSIVKSRSEGDNDSSRRIKTELFVQMDGVGSDNTDVFVMAATNTPQDLDDAVYRRFDKMVFIPLPDEKARKQMFERQFPEVVEEEELVNLAKKTDGLSGSEISKLCRKAKNLPISRLQDATHFKVNESGKFTPCGEKDIGAKQMTLGQVDSGQLFFTPIVTKEDREKCAREERPLTNPAKLRQLEKFAEERTEWRKYHLYVQAPKIKRSLPSKVFSGLLNFF